MASNDASLQHKIHIWYCKDCENHNWCTRHNQAQYEQAYFQLSNAIKNQFPDVQILVNVPPSHFVPIKAKQNKYFNSVLKKYVLFPPIGAFEIIMDNNQIFSKKNTNLWPNVSSILDIIRFNLSSDTKKPISQYSNPSLHKDQQEKLQKTTIIMADNMLKRLDENSFHYKKKKNRQQTLAEQFRKYKMKKQAKENLHHLYAECQQLNECKTSKEAEYDVKKLYELWGKNQKIPTFFKQKGVIQQHKGKKQVLVQLSSIDQESELKLSNKLYYGHTLRNSKQIQNLQSEFEKLQNKFVKFQSKVSEVNNKKFQLQYDKIYGKNQNEINIKAYSKNKKRYQMQDKVQQIKITYSPQKMLKQLKDRSNKKQNKIDKYIRSTQAQKNEKLGRIYGPQLLKQNISPLNSKRNNSRSIKLRRTNMKNQLNKQSQEVSQQSEEQSDQKQVNKSQSQLNQQQQEQQQYQQQQASSLLSQEEENSQTNFTSESINQTINKYSIIRQDKRMTSTRQKFHPKRNINQRKIYTSQKPNKGKYNSSQYKGINRNSRNSQPHKISLYQSYEVQQKNTNHINSLPQQLANNKKSKLRTTEKSFNQNNKLEQNSIFNGNHRLIQNNQKSNVKFFQNSKNNFKKKISTKKNKLNKQAEHIQVQKKMLRDTKQQIGSRLNVNKSKHKNRRYITKQELEDNNSQLSSLKGKDIQKIETQLNKMKKRNKFKSNQFEQYAKDTEKKRINSQKKNLNSNKMVTQAKSKSKQKKRIKEQKSKRFQQCQTEQQKQYSQIQKNESKVTKKKSKRQKKSSSKQMQNQKDKKKKSKIQNRANNAQAQKQQQQNENSLKNDELKIQNAKNHNNQNNNKSFINQSQISNGNNDETYTINIKEIEHSQHQQQFETKQQVFQHSKQRDQLRKSKNDDKRKTVDTSTQALIDDRQTSQLGEKKQSKCQTKLRSSYSIQEQSQQYEEQENCVASTNLRGSSAADRTLQQPLTQQHNSHLQNSRLSNYSKKGKALQLYKQQVAVIVRQFYGPEYENYISQHRTLLKEMNKSKQKQNIKNGYKKINEIYRQKNCVIFEQNSICYQSLIDNSGKMGNLLKIIKILCMRNQYLIIRLFQNPQMPQAKAYGVWLCNQYQWQLYIVNEKIEVDQHGKPLHLYHEKNQLWPIILSQALNQLFGGYERLIKASIPQLFHALTGTNYVSFQITEDPRKNAKLLKFISVNEKKNFIITAEKRMHSSLAEQQTSNMQSSIYYVLSQNVVNDNQVLLRMKKNNSDAFWIKLDKFVAEFSHVDVLQLRVNHNFNCFFPEHKNIGAGHFTIIQLNFKEESFGCVAFATEGQQTDFRLFVYKQQENNVLRLVGQLKQKNKKFAFFDCCFTAGKYLIFTQLKGRKNKVAYLGEGTPQISIKQEIQELGLKNNYTQYVPINEIPSKKQIQMPKFMAMTKKSENQNSFIIDSGLQSQKSRVDKNKLKSEFIEYLIRN